VSKDLRKTAPIHKTRIEGTIAKVREEEVQRQQQQGNNSLLVVTNTRPLPFLQVLPSVIFPVIEEPQIRYRISIPSDDLMTNPTQIVQETNNQSFNRPTEDFDRSLVQGEHNLLVRFGTLEIINGTRITSVTFNVHEIGFHIFQTYSSSGWVDPKAQDPPGQYVRSLEFQLTKFKEGTVQHQIKQRQQTPKIMSSEEGSSQQQIEITVSGIVSGVYTTGGAVGQRVEFVFVLPPHLTMKHINDVGVDPTDDKNDD